MKASPGKGSVRRRAVFLAVRPFAGALGLLLLLVAAAAPCRAAGAQAAPVAAADTRPKADQAPSRAEIESLIGTLQDDQARGHLVAQLKALIAVQQREAAPRPGLGARLMTGLSDRLETIGTGFVQVGEQLSRPDLFLTWLEDQARSPARRLFWARVFATLAGVFAAAVLADRLVQWALRRPRAGLAARTYDHLWVRIGAALVAAVFELVPIAAFAAAGYGTLAATAPAHNVRMVALAVLNAAIVVRVVVAFIRLILSPLSANLRVVPLGDETAAYSFVWARRFVIVAVYGYFIGQLSLLLRLSNAGHAAVTKVIALLVVVMIVILLLQIRPRVTELLRGEDRVGRPAIGRLRRYVAEAWHVLAIVLIFAAYFAWALSIKGGFSFVVRGLLGTLAILGIARLLVALEHRLLRQLFAISADFRSRYPGLEERASRYVPVVRGLLTTVIAAFAAIFILQIWGLNAVRALRSDVGRAVILGGLRIVLIVVLALAVIEGAGLAIARYLHAPEANGGVRQRSARARTLLPLLRNVIAIVIGSIAGISVLSQLGLDVAPLIAGVGIFGLAVGFGAQSLVKDVITGAFILFEDTIAVGDFVNLGSHSGTVEALSIRSVRLRDLSGHVHTVPFGAIEAVTNHTKEFAYYLTDVGVAYREDTDEVSAVLVEVVEDMRRDEAFAAAILAPLEVMGVQSLGDSAVTIRVRIRSRAPDQWRIGREFNRRLKKAFDAAGIEIPFPHRTLYFGVDKAGNAPPARIVVGDASDSTPREQPASVPAVQITEAEDEEAEGADDHDA